MNNKKSVKSIYGLFGIKLSNKKAKNVYHSIRQANKINVMNSDETRGNVDIPTTHDKKDINIRTSQFEKIKTRVEAQQPSN